MPSTKANSAGEHTGNRLTTTQIFELLANDRRRLVLWYLQRAVGAVSVDELADQLALEEGTTIHTGDDQIHSALVHVHLPKFAAAGVLEYDTTARTVTRNRTADQLVPYLDLTRSQSA